MPLYKGTMLFEYQGQPPCGFSESYEFEASSVAVAKTRIAAMPTIRIQWLASQWRIVGFRLAEVTMSLVSGKCKKKFVPVSIGACAAGLDGQLGDADTPYTTVLATIKRQASGHVRNFMARGIPDTWWTTGQLTIPDDDRNRFTAWFNTMKNTNKVGVVFGNPSGCSATLDPWDSYCFKRIASRKIGRPFDLLRGRRSAPPVTP